MLAVLRLVKSQIHIVVDAGSVSLGRGRFNKIGLTKLVFVENTHFSLSLDFFWLYLSLLLSSLAHVLHIAVVRELVSGVMLLLLQVLVVLSLLGTHFSDGVVSIPLNVEKRG